MNASSFRNTRFELKQLVQGPNSFGVVCTERGVHGSKIEPLEVPEGAFTDEEMAQVHATLEMLERKFAAVFDATAAVLTPAKVHALVSDSERAKREAAAAQREAQDAEAKRAAAEMETASIEVTKARLAAEVDAAAAKKRALDVEIAEAAAQRATIEAEIVAAKAAAEAPAPTEEPTK